MKLFNKKQELDSEKTNEKKLKLSRRERVLIYIMVWLLLLTIGVAYVIMPALDRHSAAKEEFIATQMKAKQMQALINNKPFMESEIVELESLLKGMEKYFYYKLDNEEIDRVVTSTELRSGFTPYNLEIGIGFDSEYMSWVYANQDAAAAENGAAAEDGADAQAGSAENGANGDANAAANVNPNGDGSQAAASQIQPSDVITKSTIGVKAQGSLQQISKFLTEAKKEKSFRITSFKINKRDYNSPLSTNILVNTGGYVNTREYEIVAVVELYQRNR